MSNSNILTFDSSGNVEIKKYHDDIRNPIVKTVDSRVNNRLNSIGEVYKPNCRNGQIHCGNQPIRGRSCYPHAHDHGICIRPNHGVRWPTGGNALFIMGGW